MPTITQIVNAILDPGRQTNFQNSNFYNLATIAINDGDPDRLNSAILLAFACGLLTQPDVDAVVALIPGSPN
jgi:hypothetical protein